MSSQTPGRSLSMLQSQGFHDRASSASPNSLTMAPNLPCSVRLDNTPPLPSSSNSGTIRQRRTGRVSRPQKPTICLNMYQKLAESFNSFWYWEIFCIFLATVWMLAVVTILVRTQKKALKDWHLPIEPNSLVSICVTVGKSALLLPIASCISQAKWIQFRRGFNPLIKLQEYDEASRGPWGSLQLLFSIRKSDWIASLGAALTIISMALDPFAQQIIAYRVRQVDAGTAYLAAAQTLDNVTDVTMQGAVLNGIYLSSTAPSTYTCISPVCRWPQPIVSLGVCSICQNVTNLNSQHNL